MDNSFLNLERAVPNLARALSDQVRDWMLDSDVISDACTIQTQYISDPGRNLRHARVDEQWHRIHELGHGSFGVIDLQECAQGSGPAKVRAVKRIRMGTNFSPKYAEEISRELAAIVKFSHKQV